MPSDTDQFDFFVSYARHDNRDGWITHFVEELLAEHRKFSGGRALTCFFDKQIRSLDDWQHRIHDGLSKSRLFLAFISPSYFASEWCRREWKAWVDTEIAKHILSAGAASIYFVEVPGFVGKVSGLREQATLGEQEVVRHVAELCGLPAPHDGFIAAASPTVRQMRDRRQVTADFVKPFADEGIDALRREDLRKVLETIARDLDQRAQDVHRAAESANTVPPYNKKFSGRLDELLLLRDRLKDDRAGVISGIHGLGGIGKTELAFTYAHAFAGAYPGGRLLVPCEGKPCLRDAALHLGDFFRDRINDEERKTPDALFAAIIACLRERLDRLGHILLILDNVTDPTVLARQETDALTALGPKLHLLGTTRMLPPSGVNGNWLTLRELKPEEALDLLEKHRAFANDAEREAARRVVKRLSGFALAVELVAAWLAQHPSATYAKLVDGLGLEDLETMAGNETVELRRHNHERRLKAVLEPTLAALEPTERRAMEYAALLPPDHVPLPWLRALVTKDFPDLGQAGRLSDSWDDLWRRLERLALLGRAEGETSEPRLVRVHRWVQELVRNRLAEEALAARQTKVNDLVNERVEVLQKTSQWLETRWEIEPLDALALLWMDAAHPQAGWLSNLMGHCWHNLAEWTRAETLMRRVLAIDEQRFGKDHPDVARDLNNLSRFLQTTNRLDEAESLIRRALAIWEQSLGENHPNFATGLNNLARLLQATNRLDEAESLYRRALAINEESLGKEHPNVAIGLNNLADLLQDTNRRAEAEPLMLRALAIAERSFGKSHPNVATALNNLAGLLRAMNRLDEAEPLYRQALAIDEQSFGKDHPDVARNLSNLAQLLHATNRLTEAEPLIRRALAIWEQSLGKSHPNVALGLDNLAGLLVATNRRDEAEPLYRQALAIDEQSFGKDHPDVARDLNNLAQLLVATNRLAEAEPLMRQVLSTWEQSFGESHPNVALALNNLAGLLQDTNHLAEAESLMRRALAIDQQSFGKDHPTVAIRLNNLAMLLLDTNRLAEAEPLLRQALAIDEQSLGQNHPDVAKDLNNLALLLEARHRPAEAEPLMRRALAIDEESFGKEHPNVAIGLNNLADLLQATNQLTEAEPLIRRALAIWEQSLGKSHPNVATALNNLARLLQATNRLDESDPLYRRALAINEQSLGKEHPNVAIGLNNLAELLRNKNRLAEAEPLMRRTLEILLSFTRATGHPHPQMQSVVNNYAGLLVTMGYSQVQIRNMISELDPHLWRLVASKFSVNMFGRVSDVKTRQPADGKIGRNDPCSCGSGKKFKKCCGRR